VDTLLPTDWIPNPHGLAGGGVPENIQGTIKTFNCHQASLHLLAASAGFHRDHLTRCAKWFPDHHERHKYRSFRRDGRSTYGEGHG
jgi:hypothetical protein